MTTKEKRIAFVKYFVAWGLISPFLFLILPTNGPHDALDYIIYLTMLISSYPGSIVVKAASLITDSSFIHFIVFSISQLLIYLLTGSIISKLLFKETPDNEENIEKKERRKLINRKF